MSGLRRLWRGELPLVEAFWTWAIAIGLTINIAALLITLSLVTEDLPLAGLIVGHGVTLPYNIVATVGVWRSAARHPGARDWPNTARAITAIMMLVLSVV